MKKSKKNYNSQDKKREELINLLKDIMNSRITLTTHREIAAWSIAVLYLTILMILFKLFLEKTCLVQDIIFKIWLSVFLIVILIIVFVFVHSQYGAHVTARSINDVCIKCTFKLINRKISLEDSKWKIKDDEYFPVFFKKDLEKKTEELHKWTKIGFWVPVFWVVIKMYFKITFWKTKKFNWENWLIKHTDYSKLQLIESSIYCVIIIPTLFFFLLLYPDSLSYIIKLFKF